MVFKVGLSTVINNEAAYIHESFPQISVGSTENVKIFATDAAADDVFGYSVAVGSGRIVVGAFNEDPGGIANAGSAYIFNLNGNHLKKITASDAAASDQFGTSVAVGSGRIVVGAPNEDPSGLADAGSAYIFDLDGNQLVKITASDRAAGDYFGTSVAVGCGRIVVGAPYEDPGGIANAGSAYIYDLNGNQLAKITASDATSFDFFGISVAVGCGRIVVGASEGNNLAGSAYIYDLNGNQLGIITASDAASNDRFGYSVAVGCGRIVVGAYTEDRSGLTDAGSAYIYDLGGKELKKITASDAAGDDWFGYSVAVGCNRIVVGAYAKDSGGLTDAGSAYIFDLDGNQLKKITASDTAFADRFGRSVAVGSGRIVVGAYTEDPGGLSDAGAAYIFNLSEDSNTYWERILETYKY